MLPTDRFPLLTPSGQRTLLWLEEHPHAPRFTHRGLSRATPAGLERAAAFEMLVATSPPRWAPGAVPAWVNDFVADRLRDTPFYRRWGPPPASFFHLPTTSRADLNRVPWAFVPDGRPLENLVVYNTSGTTGHPLSILTHADTLALYIPLLQAALRLHGLRLAPQAGQLGLAYVTYQQHTYTYAAVSPLLNESGFVKINLSPSEWNDPADRAAFLNDTRPLAYTGTPLAFAELAALPLNARPLALISTSLALNDGLRARLEQRFGCPLIDVYSMNESGPIAAAAPSLSNGPATLELLQPHLFVEIVDADGEPCPPGVRGEIALTGGFNPLLPLIRYRTGDQAALNWAGGRPGLVGLEGRPAVVFQALDGRPINNIDVSVALRPFSIAQYHLHQAADGALRLRVRGAAVDAAVLRQAIAGLFGLHQPLVIEPLVGEGKGIQYTSDLVDDSGTGASLEARPGDA